MSKTTQKSRFHMSTANMPKIVRALLAVLAALLMFAGPTYLIFVLRNHLRYRYLVSLGLVSFVVGLIIFVFFFFEEKKQRAV